MIPFTMVLFRAPDPRACGIAELDAAGRIVAFVEKPDRPATDLANAGLYVVDADAYREIAAMRAFDLGFEVLPRFVGRMRGWVWGGYYLDIGTHEALARARSDFDAIFPRRREAGKGEPRPAVFLDRDGTLIEHVHYLSDPAQVRLLPGAAEAIKRLRRAGFVCVLVTNQSAVGRGMITEARLHEINAEMDRQLPSGVRRWMPSITARTSRAVMTGRSSRTTIASLVPACYCGPRLTLAWTSPPPGWWATWSATCSPA